MESRVFVTSTGNIEVYQPADRDGRPDHGRWVSNKGDKDLKRLGRQTMLDEFRPQKTCLIDGKLCCNLSHRGDTPTCMKEIPTRNNAIDEVVLILRRDPSQVLG